MDFINNRNLALSSRCSKSASRRLDVCDAVLLSHAGDGTHTTWGSLVILYSGKGIYPFGI